MDIIHILKDLYKTRNIQKWINNRFSSHDRFVMDKRKFETFVLKTDNCQFHPGDVLQMIMIDEAMTEYDYSDLRKSDIVLDIGANAGGFTFNVASRVQKVVSVEPLFVAEFKQNRELNQFSNVELLPCALSENNITVSFGSKSGDVTGKTLTELIELAGGHVDFIKCDCEGGEWIIKPTELTGIRRIEMEVHSFNGENMYHMVEMIRNAGFDVNVSPRDETTLLLHAFRMTD